jgi:NAD(P)-dependent dehydrogenase (short-subunit alcohol dehydrogenase family)
LRDLFRRRDIWLLWKFIPGRKAMQSSAPLVLVTGSTDGIGLETARQLARHGAAVIVHGRRPERVAAARQSVESVCGRAMPEPIVADLSSLAGAAGLAAELVRREQFPEVLINNAGVFMKQLELSPDDIELTMAVNHFAPFVLTMALLQQPDCRLRRIINVSSIAHNRGRIDLDDLTMRKRRFDAYGMYAASKLALVLFTVELAERLRGKVAVNALHPGVVSTKLLTAGFGMEGPDSVADGAATSVMLALDPAYAQVTGQYFTARRPAPMNPVASDRKLCQDFFAESQRIAAAALARKPD